MVNEGPEARLDEREAVLLEGDSDCLLGLFLVGEADLVGDFMDHDDGEPQGESCVLWESRTRFTKGDSTLGLDGDELAELLCLGESGTRGECMMKFSVVQV